MLHNLIYQNVLWKHKISICGIPNFWILRTVVSNSHLTISHVWNLIWNYMLHIEGCGTHLEPQHSVSKKSKHNCKIPVQLRSQELNTRPQVSFWQVPAAKCCTVIRALNNHYLPVWFRIWSDRYPPFDSGDRGAVDAERSRVHFSWKPILYSFKKMCQPERMSRQQSRSSINVTNLEPKHDKCRDFVFSGLGSALYQAVSSNFVQPCVQKSVRKLIPFVDVWSEPWSQI